MFRIERDLVKLGAARTVRTIQIDNEINKNGASDEYTEAGAAGDAQDAAASAAATAKYMLNSAETDARAEAYRIISEAEAEANTRAVDIIAAAKEKAKAEASMMVEAARKEAEELTLSARERLEEERRLARQEGYDDGAEEGKRLYDEQLEKKMREIGDDFSEKMREDDEKVKRVVEELYYERAETYAGLEDNVVGLAIDIVRKVINPSEEKYGGIFEMLVRNALKQINPEGRIMIRVGPNEYERFFASGSALFELDGGVNVTVSVLRDASLGEGDCVIDTEESTVNAGLDTQLKYIQLAFDRVGQ